MSGDPACPLVGQKIFDAGAHSVRIIGDTDIAGAAVGEAVMAHPSKTLDLNNLPVANDSNRSARRQRLFRRATKRKHRRERAGRLLCHACDAAGDEVQGLRRMMNAGSTYDLCTSDQKSLEAKCQ
ncbi:hypothetical protein ACFQY5_38280 [Paeniroseomonas aquatica]|uniref:Uncharacterized protein n=1 Tax=Paeniroseomonas aquatica TaxID=373043 RepID=A0ABT8A2G5_9PROT|nr:hypothetical protein [Paeniroseomonas aquatica]MDN3563884.1 hypothetical protein [Paeniroseomonas aquatica]